MPAETWTPEPQSAGCARRLLIVVDDTWSPPDLCVGVRRHAPGRAIEAFVISPAHGTAATTRWYRDEDAARAEATKRLRSCLNCLKQEGIRVTGSLGGPDAVQAIAAALARFSADEILLATAQRRPSQWLHEGVIDRARHAFEQPITHVFMEQTTSGGPNARPRHSR